MSKRSDNEIWVTVNRQKYDGSVGPEILVITVHGGKTRFRFDHPQGSSVEYVIPEEATQEIVAFLTPKPDLKVVR
jgi:hypothetical protein